MAPIPVAAGTVRAGTRGLHDARTDVPTCQLLADGPNHLISYHIAYHSYMLRCKRMLIHERIHGRKDVCGRRWRKCAEQRRLGEDQHTGPTCSWPVLTAKLSHIPCAIFDNVFAEQGATRTMSAHRRSSMCRIGSPILNAPWPHESTRVDSTGAPYVHPMAIHPRRARPCHQRVRPRSHQRTPKRASWRRPPLSHFCAIYGTHRFS